MLNHGEMSCLTMTGKLSIVRLNTHVFSDDQGLTEEEVILLLLLLTIWYNDVLLLTMLFFLQYLVEVIVDEMYCIEEVTSLCFIADNSHHFSLSLPPLPSMLYVRFKDAWSIAKALDTRNSWNELAKAALHHMELVIGKSSHVTSSKVYECTDYCKE